MARRNSNGEGTVYRRKDGRYEGATYVLTVNGVRQRLRVYGATRKEAEHKLQALRTRADIGAPVPARETKVGDFLSHWLETIVRPTKRPRTYVLYASLTERYLRPQFGKKFLGRLSVSELQNYFNEQLRQGRSLRVVQQQRTALSSALTAVSRATRNCPEAASRPAR